MSIIGERAFASAPSAWATQPASAIIGLRTVLAPQPADVRIGLLGRFLADMASVEDDEVRVLAIGRAVMPLRAEQLGHSLAVIDVHLAAEAFDLESLGESVIARGL